MAKYEKYAEYKDSGVEWLGDIPKDWETGSLRWMIDIASGESLPDNCEKEYSKENQFPVVGGNGVMGFSNKVNTADSAIAVGRVGALCGNIHSIDYDSWITDNALKISKWSKFSKEFFVYLLRTANLNYLASKTAQPLITGEQVKSLKVVFLPVKEQIYIANFLDHETAQIDTLIEKQQTLICLLKEKRQAVISYAVTKGLNPDAPMKDSGVEWLGEVPEHWEHLKFDYVVNSVGDIDHYMPKSIDSGIPYLMTGDLKDLVSNIDFDKCKQVDRKSYIQLSRKTKTMEGDLILARYATIGTVSYVDIEKELLVSYACVTINPNTEIVLGKYLYWYLKSQAFADAIKRYINSNTQGNVGVDSLKRVKLIVPTLKEQESIITYIEDMTLRFDTLNKKAEQAIQLMQERRTALISAAVTGKIDVRGWVAPEVKV